jgi:hypothetical protein
VSEAETLRDAAAPAVTPYRIELSVKRFCLVLAGAAASLVLIHLIVQVLHYRIVTVPAGLNNLPSWYSWTAILIASALLFVTAAVKRRDRDRDAALWGVLGWGFLVMSLDEDASLHESLNTLVYQHTHSYGFTWTTPALGLIVVVAVVYAGFLLRLPPRLRWLILISGFIYLFGAVGMERISHDWLRAHSANTRDTLEYGVFTGVEECLEMAGIVILIYGLLDDLRAGGRGTAAPAAEPGG